jgi:serine O-acetyltransferase
MDERDYLAQALLDRLRADEVAHCRLADAPGEIDIAVPRRALAEIPRTIARFCRDFDLQLVQLLRHQPAAWLAVIAWSDDLGRPRFLSAAVCSDSYRGGRPLQRADELLRGAPETRFAYSLLKSISLLKLPERPAELLSDLWEQEPRRAMEQISRFWRRPADMRLLAQAAKHRDWAAARAALPQLRRAMRGSFSPTLGLAGLAHSALAPARAVIAFIGSEIAVREILRDAVARDLAPAFPAGVTTLAHGFGEQHRAIDVRVVLQDNRVFKSETEEANEDEAVVVDGSQPLPALLAEVERAVLRWLECRVERRFPDALVGENPPGARLLQFACRNNLFFISQAIRAVFNSDIDCRLRSPVLMPHPYGIVIDRGVQIGSRVTIMQQATIACGGGPGDERGGGLNFGAPVIEDNVCIGPGARILGRVLIGRGATIGANAVVTRDVPSHCTVVGANQILGASERRIERPAVVAGRREDHKAVVNS